MGNISEHVYRGGSLLQDDKRDDFWAIFLALLYDPVRSALLMDQQDSIHIMSEIMRRPVRQLSVSVNPNKVMGYWNNMDRV